MHFEKIILPYIAMATGIFRWLDFMVLVSCFMAFVFHFVVFRYILWISLRFVLCHRKGILLQMARHIASSLVQQKQLAVSNNFITTFAWVSEWRPRGFSSIVLMFCNRAKNPNFANCRFSFRKLQIFISQTTDFHFANYRFSFRKLQIFISQTTDSHFANYTDFHFVSFPFRFVSFHFAPFRFANYSKPFEWMASVHSKLSHIFCLMYYVSNAGF